MKQDIRMPLTEPAPYISTEPQTSPKHLFALFPEARYHTKYSAEKIPSI